MQHMKSSRHLVAISSYGRASISCLQFDELFNIWGYLHISLVLSIADLLFCLFEFHANPRIYPTKIAYF